MFFMYYGISNAQEVTIVGEIVGNDELEGIHIINKTAKKFTITDGQGKFEIPAKINDTILISSIQYAQQEVVVDAIILQGKHMMVYLKEHIYELDEVLVGKFLTGDLRNDIENLDLKHQINFYDVGIPGYTGRLKTQTERRLFEADNGKFVYFYGVGLAINVHKILNRISGRTNRLKNRVRLEALDDCMNRSKSDFSESLFGGLEIEENLKADFFFYASEDPKFLELCKKENPMAMFQFLVKKLTGYEENQRSQKD